MREFTESEILERGIAAQHLISDPTFQNVFQEVTAVLAADAFASDPKDWKYRESNYQAVRGMKLMIADLQARVSTALELQQLIEEREEDGATEQSEE